MWFASLLSILFFQPILKGIVYDVSHDHPVPYAWIALQSVDAATSSASIGRLSDSTGRFQIALPDTGMYRLHVEALGYQSLDTLLHLLDGTTDLGVIKLQPTAIALHEVEIPGKRSTIENRVDKLIFHVNEITLLTATTSLDVLRKAPMISLDEQGNLMLRGRRNVKILVNGIPATLDMVRGLPPAIIQDVEIMTVPGASYDAEATGGVINIITRKQRFDGYEGNLSVVTGTRNRNSDYGYIAIRKGKWNINGSYTLNTLKNTGYNSIERSIYGKPFTENTNNTTRETYQFGNLAFIFQPGEHDEFGLSLNAYGYRFSRSAFSTYQNSFQPPYVLYISTQHPTQEPGLYGSMDYTHHFANPANQLSFSILLNQLITRDNYAHTADSNGNASAWYASSDHTRFREMTFQSSLVYAIHTKQKWETGVKWIIRNNRSLYTSEQYNPTQHIWLPDPSNSGTFRYNQDVIAAYAQYTLLQKSWQMQAGIRWEGTALHPEWTDTMDIGRFTSSLFPSIKLRIPVSSTQQFTWSYTQKIARPSIDYLNSYTDKMDLQHSYTGNSQLQNERLHDAELEYSLNTGNIYLDASVYALWTTHAIASLTLASDSGQLQTSYVNLNKQHTEGISIYISFSVFQILQASINGVCNYTRLQYHQLSHEGLTGNAGIDLSCRLPAHLLLNGDLNIQFKPLLLQGYGQPFRYNSLQLSRAFFHGKLRVFTLVENLGNRFTGRYTTTLQGADFQEHTVSDFRFTSWKIGLNYRFGQQNSTRRYRQKILNTDLKSK